MAIQLTKAGDRLKSLNYFMFEEFSDALSYIFVHENILPTGIGMPVGLDIGADFAPPIPLGCHLEAIGYFESSGQLTISSSILNLLSPTDQAAFLAHEALYKVTRDLWGAQNSEEVRQVVAYMFSNSNMADLNNLIPHFTRAYGVMVTDTSAFFDFEVSNPDGATLDLSLACVSGVDGSVVAQESFEILPKDKAYKASIPSSNCRTFKYEYSIKDGPNRLGLGFLIKSGSQVLSQFLRYADVPQPNVTTRGSLALYW